MATVKIVQRKKKNKDGSMPLAIRVTKNRKTTFIYTGYSIKPTEWDEATQRVKKSHPNSTRLNNMLLKKATEASGKVLDLENQNDTVTTKVIKKKIKQKVLEQSFRAYAKVYLDNFRAAGNYNRYNPEKSRLKNFEEEFLGGKDITFQEVDEALLNKFAAFLKGSKKLTERTVMNHFIIIRAIFNIALKDNPALVANYPFGKEKIKIKLPDSTKIGLEIEDVQALEAINLDDNAYLNHCRNLWLFSFYLGGMRVSDVLRLQWKDIPSDRLHYQMGKNLKAGSFKLHDKAKAILEQYSVEKKKRNELIFPELKGVDLDDTFEVQRKISYAIKRIDENLRKIAQRLEFTKTLTMHISRHTFGNLSGNKIPIQMLQKLYRHSSITTTVNYQSNFIYKDTDDALNAVIGF